MRFLSCVAVVLLVAACGGTSPTPSPAPTPTRAPVADRVISGTLVLYNAGPVVRHGTAADTYTPSNLPGPDNSFPCGGTGDFADVSTNAPISVTDDSGNVLAQATLTDDIEGTYEIFPKAYGGLTTARNVTQCFYTFEFDGVPTETSYTFKVGNQNGLTKTADELQLAGWTTALILGS